MLKHMQDDGEFNMLIDDTGTLLIVCSKCKKIWTGKLTLVESPISAKRVTYMFKTALEINPSLLKNMGIEDVESFTTLKQQ